MPPAISRALRLLGVVLLLLLACPAESRSDASLDYFEMSLEELLEVEVTSVAKKPQPLAEAPAAVFIITAEDIRRSGATSIAEALRLAPGVQVARVNTNKWAVTARGFNGLFANKLLVLIDGRSVYTPLFSGVFWDVQDTVLEDIERIEVVRGPGATLWGANAVNGVINIITKNARDTQKALVGAGGGSEERGFGSARYGVKLGEDTHLRIFAKYFDRDKSSAFAGVEAEDAWHVGRGGFRLDWAPSEQDALTMQGEHYQGKADTSFNIFAPTPPFSLQQEDQSELQGGNLLARWTRTPAEDSELALQLYYDRTERVDVFVDEIRDTVDFEFQHRFALGNRQEIVWGGGYRLTHDDFGSTLNAGLDPKSRSDQLLSVFVQDEIALAGEALKLTVGSKFEYNDLSGVEVQPSARLLWRPTDRQALWTAVSRAVRTPSRAEDSGHIFITFTPAGAPGNPFGLPILTRTDGNQDFESEDLLAFELGYRIRPSAHLSLDAAAFYNDYENLRSHTIGSPVVGPQAVVLPIILDNDLEGESYGLELATQWHLLDRWRLQAAYTYFKLELEDNVSEGLKQTIDNAPRQQASLRSALDLPANLELDLWLRWVDAIPRLDIDSYLTMDVRLGWRPVEGLEFSVVGQNLFDGEHPEFVPEATVLPTQVDRGLYGKVSWRF